MNMDVNDVISFRIIILCTYLTQWCHIDQIKSRNYSISCLTNGQHPQLSDFVVSKYCSKTWR